MEVMRNLSVDRESNCSDILIGLESRLEDWDEPVGEFLGRHFARDETFNQIADVLDRGHDQFSRRMHLR
jgi:hypothetical protein